MEATSGVPAVRSWNDVGLASWLVNTCAQVGLRTPTPVQENCIPPILQGRNVIAGAPTGSGKTAAFALPILQKLSADPYGIYALVLTPTRELAYQIGDQFKALGAPLSLKVEVVVGGREMLAQSLALAQRPHVVVATPGRLLDHLNSSLRLCLGRLRYLVLDEADRLLSGTLAAEIQSILDKLPAASSRQTMLFSATLASLPPDRLEALTSQLPASPPPVSYAYAPKIDTVATLQQQYVFMPAKVKDCYLVYLLRLEEEEEAQKSEEDDDDAPDPEAEPDRIMRKTVIVFASTCKTTQLIHETLVELGVKSTPLHSELSQQQRLKSIDRFKAGFVQVLVATDVASRGLDIPTVDLVINFDMTKSPEDYVHRVGRTARAGRGGRAISLITQYDVQKVLAVEETLGKKLEEYKVAEDDALRHLTETMTARVIAGQRIRQLGIGEKQEQRKRKHQLSSAVESPRTTTIPSKSSSKAADAAGQPPREKGKVSAPSAKLAKGKAKKAKLQAGKS